MKKLIFSMIILIAFTFTINVNAIEVPEADVNARTYTLTYQTTIQDEMLYYSNFVSTTYSSKKQVIQYVGALYGDYTDNVYGGAKILYYNLASGAALSSVAIDLNEYHELDSSYNYYRIQLVYALVTNISDDRVTYEASPSSVNDEVVEFQNNATPPTNESPIKVKTDDKPLPINEVIAPNI